MYLCIHSFSQVAAAEARGEVLGVYIYMLIYLVNYVFIYVIINIYGAKLFSFLRSPQRRRVARCWACIYIYMFMYVVS